ncbi:hypothetical protein LOTGIDRAFT_169532 [Lottia gigantea]|uniref:Uncharacterized protein n=1 Tax=Lottia gigantea TaxID=225164 RepID=V4B3Z5_LOTGI|nr:hypothetical protein LOTGIDRAFT_169532 [Lottia gigantea]ESO83129.1 hypothetical protein LOTGIDRAFT_169532 [Lottia gigantea]
MLLLNLGLFVAIICGAQSADLKFDSGINKCKLDNREIDEASGLAASQIHPGILYMENDKGDTNRIFAVDTTNCHMAAMLTIAGVDNYDWEDLAVGPCGSNSCIYIAETGDHAEDGAKNIIYRVREPAIMKNQTLQLDSQLHFKWGEPDCETVMITPNEDVYTVSKVVGGHGRLAKFSHTAWGSGKTVAAEASVVLNQSSSHHDPVGGDISLDGKEMLIKYKQHVYYWHVPDGDYIKAVTSVPIELPIIKEKRGESVCWDARGIDYYTISEGKLPDLHYFKRTSSIIG